MDLESEFTFIRDELKKIAFLMAYEGEGGKVEAIFKVGCLHNICDDLSLKFKKREKDG